MEGVRPATQGDLMAIARLVKHMNDDNADGKYWKSAPKIDFPKVFATIDEALINGSAWVAVSKEGYIVGAIVAELREVWMSRERFASEVFVYVAPEYRDRGFGLKLYRALLKWAEETGVRPYVGENCGHEVERMEQLYAHFGLEKVGSVWIGEVN
jgi:GNAT superfamily N-acetyltransferase